MENRQNTFMEYTQVLNEHSNIYGTTELFRPITYSAMQSSIFYEFAYNNLLSAASNIILEGAAIDGFATLYFTHNVQRSVKATLLYSATTTVQSIGMEVFSSFIVNDTLKNAFNIVTGAMSTGTKYILSPTLSGLDMAYDKFYLGALNGALYKSTGMFGLDHMLSASPLIESLDVYLSGNSVVGALTGNIIMDAEISVYFNTMPSIIKYANYYTGDVINQVSTKLEKVFSSAYAELFSDKTENINHFIVDDITAKSQGTLPIGHQNLILFDDYVRPASCTSVDIHVPGSVLQEFIYDFTDVPHV